MVSIKEIFTKDIPPFKTVPLRRTGFSVGVSYCIAALLSLLIYSILNGLGITHIRNPIVLPIGLTYIIYQQWFAYAKSINSKQKKL